MNRKRQDLRRRSRGIINRPSANSSRFPRSAVLFATVFCRSCPLLFRMPLFDPVRDSASLNTTNQRLVAKSFVAYRLESSSDCLFWVFYRRPGSLLRQAKLRADLVTRGTRVRFASRPRNRSPFRRAIRLGDLAVPMRSSQGHKLCKSSS
jgi:hypothetical protein